MSKRFVLDPSRFKDEASYSRLKCPYCVQLLYNPVQPSCGHRLCQPCADEIIKKESPPRCPLSDCKEEFILEDGEAYFPDRFVRREILGLKVYCQYQSDGCDWEGTLSEYDAHVDKCDYSTKAAKKCPLVPFGCTETTMDDSDLQKHIKECEYDHLVMIANCFQLLSRKVTKLQAPNRSVMGRVESDSADVRSYIPGYERAYVNSHENDSGFPSMKLKDTLHSLPEKPWISASVEVPITMQLHEMVTKEMVGAKDQLTSAIMESMRSIQEEVSSLRTQVTKLEKQIRAKNAELEDRDFRLSLIENSNHDGSMIWKIPQFSQRKADAENGKYTSIFSLPFYTGRYGFKMCLRLYIMGDGIGKGTHLSLFFVVMRGEFDNILQWPFTHKVTFKLINQAGGRDIVDTFQPDPMSSSFRKPKSDMNIASGCPRFVSHTELERGGFVVDDTIFIKCLIDTSTARHP